MRTMNLKWAFAFAAVGLMTAPLALAIEQGTAATPVKRVSAAEPTYGSYFASDFQDEAPSVPAPDGDAVPIAAGDGGDCGCEKSGCDSCGRNRLIQDCNPIDCDDCDPWRLFGCYNDSNCLGVNVYGFVAIGYAYNGERPANRSNLPVTFINRDNELTANQAWTTIERTIDQDDCNWQLGGRVDFMAGSDAAYTQAVGLDDKWNNRHGYGSALPQAYLEIGNDRLSVKLGHYFTIVGYEVVPANGNFFMSHAYTMQYAEPFTHTGALATYKLNDQVNVMAGADLGWDRWRDDNRRASFLGGVSWTSCDERTTIALTGTIGDEAEGNALTAPNGSANRWMTSFVLSHELTSRWTYVLQSDVVNQNGVVQQDGELYGINQYVFYKINCCWDAGLRVEWFRDDDGGRVRNAAGNYFAGNFYEVTAGLNWKPRSNWIIRPEARWDWFDGIAGIGAGGPLPFNGGTSARQFTLAVDAIMLW